MAQGYFELIGNAYLLLVVIVTVAALSLPQSGKGKAIALVIGLGLVYMPYILARQQQAERKKVVAQEKVHVSAAKQRFDELCKTAGEKIYRTVDDVDSLMLLKVRPKLEFQDYADPMLPGAAMAGESAGDSYIQTFLGVELNDHLPGHRGSIALEENSPLPRYHYVEAVDPTDGKRYRYFANMKRVEFIDSSNGKPNSSESMGVDRKLADGAPPQYAVDYEDIVNASDRKMWIAGTTIRVMDQKNGEVLGEYTTYAMDAGMGTTNGTRAPWEYASSHGSMRCPHVKGSTGSHTRYFVDRVLKPKKGEYK